MPLLSPCEWASRCAEGPCGSGFVFVFVLPSSLPLTATGARPLAAVHVADAPSSVGIDGSSPQPVALAQTVVLPPGVPHPSSVVCVPVAPGQPGNGPLRLATAADVPPCAGGAHRYVARLPALTQVTFVSSDRRQSWVLFAESACQHCGMHFFVAPAGQQAAQLAQQVPCAAQPTVYYSQQQQQLAMQQQQQQQQQQQAMQQAMAASVPSLGREPAATTGAPHPLSASVPMLSVTTPTTAAQAHASEVAALVSAKADALEAETARRQSAAAATAGASAPPLPPDDESMHASLHSDADTSDDPPTHFVDPISMELMTDPVLLVESGMSYERSSIDEWLGRGGATCPSTGIALETKRFVANTQLRQAIEEWVEAQAKQPRPSQTVPPPPQGHQCVVDEQRVAEEEESGWEVQELPLAKEWAAGRLKGVAPLASTVAMCSFRAASAGKSRVSADFALTALAMGLPALAKSWPDGRRVLWMLELPPGLAERIRFSVKAHYWMKDPVVADDIAHGDCVELGALFRHSSADLRYLYVCKLKLLPPSGSEVGAETAVATHKDVFAALGNGAFGVRAIIF